MEFEKQQAIGTFTINYFNNDRDWRVIGEDLFGVLLPGSPVDDHNVILGFDGQVGTLILGQGCNERGPLDFTVAYVGSVGCLCISL